MLPSQNNKQYVEDLHLYKYIASISEELISFIGLDYTYQVVNDMYLKAHNKKREEIINYSIAKLHGEAVFRNIIKEKIDRCFRGESIKYEDWFELNGAGRLFMEVTYYPFKADATAEISGVVVIARDITASKLNEDYKECIEKELHESNKSYKQAQKIANIGSWEWNLKTDTRMFSDEYYRLFGFADNENATHEQCLARIHPSDIEVVNKAISDTLDGNNNYSVEYRINLPCNQQKYIHGMGRVEYDKNNKPILFRGTVHNITKQKRAELALRESERQSRLIMDNTFDALIVMDQDGFIRQWNSRAEDIFGWSNEEILNRKLSEVIIPPIFRSSHDEGLKHFLNTQKSKILNSTLEISSLNKDGHEFPIELSIVPIKTGETYMFNGFIRDITERKQAEEKLQQHSVVFQAAREAIIITDAARKIQQVNQAFTNIIGYSEQDVVGKTPSLWRSERHDDAFYDELYNTLEKEGEWQGEIWNRRKNGEIVPVWQSITEVKNKQGQVKQYISIFSDMSERVLAEERFRHLAHYDVLTDLPNRVLFNERCKHSIARTEREDYKMAVLFLDLDRFKHINDSLGHPTGDELLRLVAIRLLDQVRKEDTVARLGGDEFTLILEQVSRPEDAKIIARKIIDAFQYPFNIQGHQLHIGTSIGISIFPDNGLDVTTLIKNADAAMYHAKEKGRNRYEFYTTKLTETAIERVSLEYQLHHALEEEKLILFYQPQVSISTAKVIGAEALIRLQNSNGDLVSPDQFIPLAEETGLIIPIGDWVLRAACEQFKCWKQQAVPLERIAVNISVVQLYHENFIDTVINTLKLTGLEPQFLELEITESLVMKETERVIIILKELRELGVTIAIDDFGTGHSSLGQLKQLPIDKLKIDRSFVMDLTENSNDEAIIKTILALGNSMDIAVIAEGVETKEQLDILKINGCNEVQGYFYSPPVPPEKFIDLV